MNREYRQLAWCPEHNKDEVYKGDCINKLKGHSCRWWSLCWEEGLNSGGGAE